MHRDFQKIAPHKRKTVRGNQSPFINEQISKAIMKRTELLDKALKYNTEESRQEFVKRHNYCISFLRKLERNYYSNLNVKFRKTIKSLFSDKKTRCFYHLNRIKENRRKSNEVPNIFTSSLQILESNNINPQSERMSSPIMKYRRHHIIKVV